MNVRTGYDKPAFLKSLIMQQGVHAIDVNKSVCKRPYPDKQPARKARALMYNEILPVEVQ